MNRAALALLFFLFSSWSLHADDASLKLEELTRKAKEVEGTYLSEEKKLKSIDAEVQRMQKRISRVKENIMSKQAQISILDKELAAYRVRAAADSQPTEVEE